MFSELEAFNLGNLVVEAGSAGIKSYNWLALLLWIIEWTPRKFTEASKQIDSDVSSVTTVNPASESRGEKRVGIEIIAVPSFA